MTDIINTAQAIATAIGGSVAFVPEFGLNEAETQRIIVVPSATAAETEARGLVTVRHTIQVALVKRVTDVASVGAMVTALQGIGATVLGSSYAGLKCTALEYPTLYGAAELREKRIFVGVITLTLAGV